MIKKEDLWEEVKWVYTGEYIGFKFDLPSGEHFGAGYWIVDYSNRLAKKWKPKLTGKFWWFWKWWIRKINGGYIT